MTLWLIGGTQESAALATAISQAHLPCVVTVTTESARSLYAATPEIQIWVGKLATEQLAAFLQHYQIRAILDASHPFAVEVSQLAIATSTQYQIPYLRYERPGLSSFVPTDDRGAVSQSSSFLYLDSFEALLSGNLLDAQRVLLTIGYRSLHLFQPWQKRATLFARILPSVDALQAALMAGFTPDRLIAVRPPVAIELEKALWQQWQISMVVTKASGSPGGEDVKRQAATELGVKLVVIDRPAVAYPQQTSDLQAALAFCQRSLA